MKNNKWNESVKASAEDLYELVDVTALRERSALLKGVAAVSLAVSGLLATGCAGEATDEPNKIVLDENGQPVDSDKSGDQNDKNTTDSAKDGNKSTHTKTCAVQLKSVIHINPVGSGCQND